MLKRHKKHKENPVSGFVSQSGQAEYRIVQTQYIRSIVKYLKDNYSTIENALSPSSFWARWRPTLKKNKAATLKNRDFICLLQKLYFSAHIPTKKRNYIRNPSILHIYIYITYKLHINYIYILHIVFVITCILVGNLSGYASHSIAHNANP